MCIRDRNIDVHIKIDTGMHRLGIDPEDIASVEEVFTLPHLRVRGMYTHLCVSDALDEASRAFTEAQRRSFFALAEELCRRGYCVGKLHTQSSYGLLNYPDARCSYARVGIALYGVRSSRGDDAARWPGLEPALSLKARVEQVRSVKAGEGLGYGLAYTAPRESRIAVLPIGYGDGFPRAAEGACALINLSLIHISASSGKTSLSRTEIAIAHHPSLKLYAGQMCIRDRHSPGARLRARSPRCRPRKCGSCVCRSALRRRRTASHLPGTPSPVPLL